MLLESNGLFGTTLAQKSALYCDGESWGPWRVQEECFMGYLPPLGAFRAKWSLCPHTITLEQCIWWHFNSHSAEYTHRNCHLDIGGDIFSMVVKGINLSINPSQQPADGRRSRPWTSGQLIVGLRERDKHPFTLMLSLELPVYLSYKCPSLSLLWGDRANMLTATATGQNK